MRRASGVLVGLALCLAWRTPRAGAQERRAEPDTMRAILVFSDVLNGRGEYAVVTLAGGTAYRIEVIPATATVNLRPLMLNAQPPAIRGAMENPAEAAGGRSLVAVPGETGAYRVEVAAAEPVRVRILSDPREQALLEGRARSALGVISVGGRAVWLPGQVATATGTVSGLSGWELCLGVVPGAVPFARRLSGCALAYDRLASATGGTMTLVGLAPRYTVHEGPVLAVAIAANISLGGKFEQGSSPRATYQALGLGVNARIVTAMRHLEIDVEPGLSRVRRDSYEYVAQGGQRTEPADSRIVPRIAAGIHIRF